jgi:regulator of RNase E activity RraA
VGDGDGVVVIPRQLVDEVVEQAAEQERRDAWVAERVAEGSSIDGLFPMDERWKARYEAERMSANKEH